MIYYHSTQFLNIDEDDSREDFYVYKGGKPAGSAVFSPSGYVSVRAHGDDQFYRVAGGTNVSDSAARHALTQHLIDRGLPAIGDNWVDDNEDVVTWRDAVYDGKTQLGFHDFMWGYPEPTKRGESNRL